MIPVEQDLQMMLGEVSSEGKLEPISESEDEEEEEEEELSNAYVYMVVRDTQKRQIKVVNNVKEGLLMCGTLVAERNGVYYKVNRSLRVVTKRAYKTLKDVAQQRTVAEYVVMRTEQTMDYCLKHGHRGRMISPLYVVRDKPTGYNICGGRRGGRKLIGRRVRDCSVDGLHVYRVHPCIVRADYRLQHREYGMGIIHYFQ